MSFLNNLMWRYAVKKYTGAPVDNAKLEKILDAIRMAPSASGTQPYHIVVASGQMKNTLIQSSGQVAKIDASHLLVFCTRIDYPARGEEQVAINAALQNKKPEELAGLSNLVKSTIESKGEPDSLRAWAARQAYIALGFALAACAELEVDSSPMEGFKPAEFKKILELPEYIDPVAIMALGYRDSDDGYLTLPKMRFPKEDLFEFRQ